MEGSSEASDDQGSGWFEVKKKHRSSSKYSIRGLVGGFPNRRSSDFPLNQSSASARKGNLHTKQGYKNSQGGQEYAGTHTNGENCRSVSKAKNDVNSPKKLIVNEAGELPESPSGRSKISIGLQGQTGNVQEVIQEEKSTQASGQSCSSVSKLEKDVDCPEKCVVNQACELPKSPSSRSQNTIDSNGNAGNIQEVTQKEKLIIPKIKWGDLEDDALVLRSENRNQAEIKFGNLGDDNPVMLNLSRDAADSVSSDPCIPFQQDKAVVISLESEHIHSGIPSSAVSEKTIEENFKGINCISSNYVGLSDLGEKMVSPNEAGSSEEICHEHILPTGSASDGLTSNNPVGEIGLSSYANEVTIVATNQGTEDKFEDGCPGIPEIKANRVSGVVLCGADSVLPSVVKTSSEASDDVPGSSAIEDLNESPDGMLNMNMSKIQYTNPLGEGESGESKERFRERLWCFLFENLNRAVDELYLLCELESDFEQTNEAILVLEEARSDFTELKSRVQGFEEVKKAYSQTSVDGPPVNLKTDHRRPHSLSWEVRRMTSSPHRAEILSSSLEAFKKIQNERASMNPVRNNSTKDNGCDNLTKKSDGRGNAMEALAKSRRKSRVSDIGQRNMSGHKRNVDGGRSGKVAIGQNNNHGPNTSQMSSKDSCAAGKYSEEPRGSASDSRKQVPNKERVLTDIKAEKNLKLRDLPKRQIRLPEREKERETEKKTTASSKFMDAWKEKRNWEDILASPLRGSSRVSYSPGMSRKSAERARVLHDKLMSPNKKKKNAVNLKKEAEEKHARAMRIRSDLENEKVQKQRTREKLSRVNEWQADRTMKLREGMHARHQRGESRHEAYLAEVVRRAGDESSKVNEVRFITSLNEENKKLILRQKLQDSELRRAEKLQIIKSKQKEEMAREEAVLERGRLLQAEKLQRLAEIQRRKEEAQVRREEERKASSAAREAKAVEQQRKKEVRAKAQQEEAELLAQKLAERLSESEQRRKFYLEQIRERASMDFRDQSSPLLRRSLNKEGLGRSISTSNIEDYQASSISGVGSSALGTGSTSVQHSLKRKIKKIRQRLMALKYELPEPPFIAENTGVGYRALVGTARAKIGRWLQELQRLRQARKEGAASIGLIVGDMIKFLEGKEPELNASRQAGLLDFIASALPASYTSKPEACQVTIYLLRLLRVVLPVAANRSYFLAQNLLPPIIPVLSAALDNYIKIAASLNIPGSTNSLSSKTSPENFASVSEVLEGLLWTVTAIIGHTCYDEKQLQMQDDLLELVIAYQVIHRLRDLFALYDRPHIEGSPFPPSIISSLNLLAVLTSKPRTISSIDWDSFPSKSLSEETEESKLGNLVDLGLSSTNETTGDNRRPLSVLDTIAEKPLFDGLGERPLDESLKASKCEELPSDAGILEKGLTVTTIKLDLVSSALMHETHGHIKPLSQKDSTGIAAQKSENFQGTKKPVAFLLSAIAETGLVSLPSLLTAVLLQANNRLSSEQASYILPSNFEEVSTGVLKVLNNLALLDINLMQRMLARPDLKMEFFHLMSFFLSHCTIKWKSATDQVGLLLLESLLLLGYFALFHPGNQAVLRWGKSPTILHKVCDLPFVFFSDPELMPILAGTLVAACYGCEQNKDVVQQELSTEMILSLLKSCQNGLLVLQSESAADDASEVNQSGTEPKKCQGDFPSRSNRYNSRNTRLSIGKVGISSSRIGKLRNQKDNKATKTCEEWALKHNLPASETSSSFMLHTRFPGSFIHRAEEFFSADLPTV